MTLRAPIHPSVWRSLRRTDGAVSVEAVLILPPLFVLFLVCFNFINAYRMQTNITRASYVVGDLLSRQIHIVRDKDVEGLRNVFAYVTSTGADTDIRVSEVLHRVDAELGIDRYEVVWSEATGAMSDMTTANLQDRLDALPSLSPNERVTVLEGSVLYAPTFHIGIAPYRMTSFTVTSQRYAGQLCIEIAGGGSSCD